MFVSEIAQRPEPGPGPVGRGCCCNIVPLDVLRRYSRDASLDAQTRARLGDTFADTRRMRIVRDAHRVAALHSRALRAQVQPAAAAAPSIDLYDCQHRRSLPGRPVADPAESNDEAVRTVFGHTTKVAEFYQTVLGRNSIDRDGMDLVSSVHYRVGYDNAFWNGQQMVYGDGDGTLFLPFYRSADVIGHEITHGVTEHESALTYEGESGALNESVSDVFGAVFNQWLNNWDAAHRPGWQIGADIMGPQATGAGKRCLRDMADPAAEHCLSPQPDHYAKIDPTADVHENSGVGNRAFAAFALAVGGSAWEVPLGVWYSACTGGKLSSGATYAEFAGLTVQAASGSGGAELAAKLSSAWADVGVVV